MTWRGEIELAAWELRSGGCAWRPYAWVDRVTRTLGGLLLMPAGTVRAFVRGAGAERNLYGLRASEVLPMEFGQLRRLVNALTTERTAADGHPIREMPSLRSVAPRRAPR